MQPAVPGVAPPQEVALVDIKPESAKEKVEKFYEGVGLTREDAPEAVIRPLSAAEVTCDSSGAEELARAGEWKELLTLAQTSEFKQYTRCNSQEKVRRIHIHILALLHVGERSQTCNLLDKLAGEVIPFSLSLLRAELMSESQRYGKVGSQRALYALLAENMNGVDPKTDNRRLAITNSLIQSHVSQEQIGCALKLLSLECKKYPTCVARHHRYVCLLMQYGHIDTAPGVLEVMRGFPDSPAKVKSINSLSALLHVCDGNYESASEVFSQNEESDIASMSNKAVCAVYTEKLPQAVTILESSVAKNPTKLSQAAYGNLRSLYDMLMVCLLITISLDHLYFLSK